jgi:hypothetical protein
LGVVLVSLEMSNGVVTEVNPAHVVRIEPGGKTTKGDQTLVFFTGVREPGYITVQGSFSEVRKRLMG